MQVEAGQAVPTIGSCEVGEGLHNKVVWQGPRLELAQQLLHHLADEPLPNSHQDTAGGLLPVANQFLSPRPEIGTDALNRGDRASPSNCPRGNSETFCPVFRLSPGLPLPGSSCQAPATATCRESRVLPLGARTRAEPSTIPQHRDEALAPSHLP